MDKIDKPIQSMQSQQSKLIPHEKPHEATEELLNNPLLPTSNVQPFDWLTSAASLDSILIPLLGNTSNNRVLHVGCGSSILGELLIEDSKYNVSSVVNVDCDIETLNRMEQRWRQKVELSQATKTILNENALQFVVADFTLPNALEYYISKDNKQSISTFDLVLDKSTLDCMLCTDTGAIGLLMEAYRCLKEGGTYLVISFHPSEFIVPLLKNLPGADWDVSYTNIPRQIENLNLNCNTSTSTLDHNRDVHFDNEFTDNDTLSSEKKQYTWSSGVFQPDEKYIRTVTVVQCRRRSSNGTRSSIDNNNCLDWDLVYEHVHKINNQWYQQMNPMLTKDRVQTIQNAFHASEVYDRNYESDVGSRIELDLQQCYSILFTDDERENLSYDDFLEDWRSFLLQYSPKSDTNQQLPIDRMSYETAIAFLHVMQ